MGKAIAYTVLVIVCLGIGLLIGGLGVYYLKPHLKSHTSVTIREAICMLRKNSGPNTNDPIKGYIYFSQAKNMDLNIIVNISGLPSHKHGFHIHTYGVVDYDCSTAGGHFNPRNSSHGGPHSEERHVGDLGNIDGSKPLTDYQFTDSKATLFGEDSIMGRSVVVHEEEDDLKDQSSAGGRIACCTIQRNK